MRALPRCRRAAGPQWLPSQGARDDDDAHVLSPPHLRVGRDRRGVPDRSRADGPRCHRCLGRTGDIRGASCGGCRGEIAVDAALRGCGRGHQRAALGGPLGIAARHPLGAGCGPHEPVLAHQAARPAGQAGRWRRHRRHLVLGQPGPQRPHPRWRANSGIWWTALTRHDGPVHRADGLCTSGRRRLLGAGPRLAHSEPQRLRRLRARRGGRRHRPAGRRPCGQQHRPRDGAPRDRPRLPPRLRTRRPPAPSRRSRSTWHATRSPATPSRSGTPPATRPTRASGRRRSTRAWVRRARPPRCRRCSSTAPASR